MDTLYSFHVKSGHLLRAVMDDVFAILVTSVFEALHSENWFFD